MNKTDKIALLVIAIILGVVGYTLIGLYSSWYVAAGVLLAIWAENIVKLTNDN